MRAHQPQGAVGFADGECDGLRAERGEGGPVQAFGEFVGAGRGGGGRGGEVEPGGELGLPPGPGGAPPGRGSPGGRRPGIFGTLGSIDGIGGIDGIEGPDGLGVVGGRRGAPGCPVRIGGAGGRSGCGGGDQVGGDPGEFAVLLLGAARQFLERLLGGASQPADQQALGLLDHRPGAHRGAQTFQFRPQPVDRGLHRGPVLAERHRLLASAVLGLQPMPPGRPFRSISSRFPRRPRSDRADGRGRFGGRRSR